MAIYRCHYSGSKVSYEEITESSSKPSGTAERWWRNKSSDVLLLHVKKFSLFEIFTGDKVTPPPPPPPPPAPVVVEPGSQVADYRATIKYVDMTKWTRPLNGVLPFVGFEWFPCHEWLGTTDVLAGYWGMKRIIAEKGTLTSADGAIWRAFQTSGDEVSSKEMIMGALGQVKACVNRMTNGKRPNLSFIRDENTVMKLTAGFEYEAE